jgi:Bacterial regulatory proteins, gntR family
VYTLTHTISKAMRAPDTVTSRRTPLSIVGPAATDSPPPVGATERIVDSITTAIVERRLMPGTKLSEQKLGDIFQAGTAW